jgi:hypothetical protein
MNADPNHGIRMPTIASQRILRAIVDERRRALSRSLHREEHCRATLDSQLGKLRKQAEALRAQTIVLNAKLAALAGDPSFERMRARLVDSTARLDHAVNRIIQSAE